MGGAGDILPSLLMIVVQIGYAGMNISSKVAMNAGMKPLVLVAYRQIFATLVLIPPAYFFEWKTRPRLTKHILLQIFLCSLTGVTANQVLYFLGLYHSTATIGCALTNLLPAFTFVLAVVFRQETLGIKQASGQAKVIGTILCVGGAMLLSFYHGHLIDVAASKFQWTYAVDLAAEDITTSKPNFLLGPIFLMASALGWAAWFIIQAKVSAEFPAPYTSTVLMLFMGTIECVVIGFISEHHLSAWSLRSNIRLGASLYAGIVASGLAFFLTSWCIQRKGALYASVFTPLLLIIVAVFSWILLHEKIYAGTAIGSVMIIVGLYIVLWGKEKEMDNIVKEGKEEMKLELESGFHSKGNDHHSAT